MATHSRGTASGLLISAIFRIALALLLFTLLIVQARNVTAGEKLRIGWVYAMGNTPLLIANYNGMIKQQGLEVELVQFDSGPLIKRAIEAGDLDLAYIGMPALARTVADGSRMKIVAKVNYGNAALITKKGSSITRLSDLKNKKIAGIRKGSGMDVLLRGYVLGELARLDPKKDLTILNMPAKMMDAAVNRGVVDAAFTWEPFVSLGVLTEHAQVILDTNEAIPNHPWYVLAATESVLKNRRDEVYKLLRAHRQAVRYLRSDPSAGMSLIIKTFNLEQAVNYSHTDLSAEEVVLEARKRIGWECQFRHKDRKFLQKLIDLTQDLGYFEHRMYAERLIDDEAIEYLDSLDH